MKQTLEQEAEQYYKSLQNKPVQYPDDIFIAGANSNYVKRQIIEAQIQLCNDALSWSNKVDPTSDYIEKVLIGLKQQLKELGTGRFYCKGLSNEQVTEVENKITELCKRW